jgi:spore maturation protein CgeB
MYEDFQDLASRFEGWIEEADCVVIGSYVPDGAGVAEWVTQTAPGVVAFFDLDTPSTLQELADGTCEYLDGSLIPTFDLILSFTGGPTLNLLASRYGAQRAQPFYASIDPAACTPSAEPPRWDLGYLGTYCADRQEALHRLLIQTARRGREFSMAVAGSHYPVEILWPTGVERIHYLAPHQHAAFYTAQRFALQITRAARRAAGFTPSVRLFEAAACGTPVITDAWSGLETFFIPGREILLAENADDVLRILRDTPESERRAIGERARRRVLQHHTASHRAELLERLICEIQPRVTGRILTAV